MNEVAGDCLEEGLLDLVPSLDAGIGLDSFEGTYRSVSQYAFIELCVYCSVEKHECRQYLHNA